MKIQELFDNEKEGPEEIQARKLFESVVYSKHTRFCHESPENYKEFMVKGITDESTFARVNEVSNFVFSLEKTRIWFLAPPNVLIQPDWRYESYEHLVQESPKITGADVVFNSKIPLKYILNITHVTPKGSIVMYNID